LSTSFVSATELTANVPSNLVASMGFAAITVSTPAPGGGMSNALPFSIYATVNLSANHLLYDPYTRLLYASVNSASTQTPGNTLVTIDPKTGNLGTPVSVGSQPGKMALTDDGNFLYVNLNGANAVGRFNMTTQHLDFSFAVSSSSIFTPALRDIAVLPGSETTVAVDLGEDEGLALYDVNPANRLGALRCQSCESNRNGAYKFLRKLHHRCVHGIEPAVPECFDPFLIRYRHHGTDIQQLVGYTDRTHRRIHFGVHAEQL
jgi:hypothetical protein